jgi:hypothetical protein
MSLGIIDSTVLTDIADAIRDTFGTTKTYKPTQMANAIRTQGKPLYSFSDATDEELTEMVNAYYNGIITLDEVKSVWSVGDKRKINLSAMEAQYTSKKHIAQEQEITILDFNCDNMTNAIDEYKQALVSLQLVNILSDEQGDPEDAEMDLSLKTPSYWEICDARSWCNNIFKNALPNYIQNLIKQVSKEYYKNYGVAISTCDDYVWFLSEYEIFGTTNLRKAEGINYEYYQNSSNRLKYSGNTNIINSYSYPWWTRTNFTYSDDETKIPTYGLVDNIDKIKYDSDGSTTSLGIAPAFCI